MPFDMLVLHAGKFDDGVAFWAEETAEPRNQERGRAGRGDIPGYVFGAGHSRLLGILKWVGIAAPKQNCSSELVWLPARPGGEPVPSTDLLVSSDGDDDNDNHNNNMTAKGKPVLRMFEVDVVKLSGADCTDLLCAVMGKRAIKPGVIVGADLEYMADAMRLAGSLVARQQYLPDMAFSDLQYTAVWRPVLTARDSERAESLARRMPGSVWAFADSEYYGMHDPDAALEGDGPGRGRGKGKRGRPATPGAPGKELPAPRGSARSILFGIITGFVGGLVRQSASASRPPTFHRLRKFDSIHDSWLHKLRTIRPVALAEPDAPQMLEQVRQWRHPVTAMTESTMRFCFRLEEPDGQDGTWFVRYMVQSRDDPSLMIDADNAWESGASLLPGGENVREFLLTSLGQASGIFPSISSGLSGSGLHSGIRGCMISGDDAYRFLTEEAAALEQAGYGVMLPSWWTGRGTRSDIKAKIDIQAPAMKAGGMLSLQSIVAFDWKIAVGDAEISIKDLKRLADAKSPLVKMRGEWVVMEPGDVDRAIKFLQKNSKKRSTLLDLVKMDIGAHQGGGADGGLGSLDVEITSGDGRVLQMLNQLNGKASLEDAGQPDEFSGTLRPYQIRGVSWLAFLKKWGLGGCLADDMGLGKTVQILALLQHRALELRDKAGGGGRKGGEGAPFLLVCPTSVMSNWQREAARFTPGLSVMIHHGSGRLAGAAFRKKARGHDMVISSYGLLHRDIKSIKKMEWAGVILDEAQHVKNPNTKQSRAARSIETDCRFALTGTPVENNVGDLWAIMEFLNPGFLGSQSYFKDRFFMPIQSMQDEGASRALKRATGPFILRRLKTDKSIISDLPDKIESKSYCHLTREQASLYAATVKTIEDAIEESDGIKRKGIILSSLAKLKQVCDHPAILLKDNSGIYAGNGRVRSGKMAVLTEMLSEVVDAGDSALVFTQFVQMGHMLRRHMQETFGIDVMFLHGGTPRRQRDLMISRFQGEDGDDGSRADGAGGDGSGSASGGPAHRQNRTSRIFVISLKAGGTGLNLTAANHVFHFDRWWNPAVEDQATDRAFRIGQNRNVQVHKMICSGTLEEKIDQMLERKKEVSRKVIGTGESWLTEMSNDDLRGILALSAGAVAEDSAAPGDGDEYWEE